MEPTTSEKHITGWDKKRKEFFASNPKCKYCGRDLDHYSRTMICRNCQKTIYKNRARAKAPEYRKKHREKIQAYQKNYYLTNREAISLRKKIKYKKKKRGRNGD